MVDKLVELIENRNRLLGLNADHGRNRRVWVDSSILFSASNDRLNKNVRSYFDRWRDRADYSGTVCENRTLLPTWRLDLSQPKLKTN
jgi:hypothetical protein